MRRSILVDTKADALIYGMGELQVLSFLKRLSTGEKIHEINDIAGTAIIIKAKEIENYKK